MSETTGDPLTPSGDPFEASDDPFHTGVDEETMDDGLTGGDDQPGRQRDDGTGGDPGQDPGDDMVDTEVASPT